MGRCYTGSATSRCFLSRSFCAWKRCFPAQLFCQLVNIQGMLVRLFAELMGRQVIFFAMGDSRRRVRVGCKVVEFCSSLVLSL
jgi:hypothetical protein